MYSRLKVGVRIKARIIGFVEGRRAGIVALAVESITNIIPKNEFYHITNH